MKLPIIKNLTRPDKNPTVIIAEFWDASNDNTPVMVYILDLNCRFHIGMLNERMALHISKTEGNCVHICRDKDAAEKWK